MDPSILKSLIISILCGIFIILFLALVRRRLHTMAYRRLDECRLRYGPVVRRILEDPDVGLSVLHTPSGSPEREAVEAELLEIYDTASEEEKGRIGDILERLGYADKYREKLENGRPWQKALAAERLGIVRSRGDVPRLIKALERGDKDVRNMAAYSLGLIGEEEAIPAIIEGLKKGLEDQDEISIRIVKSALLSFGKRAVPFLKKELQNPWWRVRSAVLDILGDIGDPGTIEDFRRALRDPEPDVRAKAAKGLGKFRDRGAVDILIELTRDPYWVVRLHSIRALGLIGDPAAIDCLKSCLLDTNWQVRRAAAEALGEMKEAALPALADILLHNHDRYAREQMIEELQRSGLLRRIIGDLVSVDARGGQESERVLEAVIRCGALSPLVNAMKRDGPGVRRRLVKILEKAGGRKALELVKSAATDTDPVVRQEATEVLRRTGT